MKKIDVVLPNLNATLWDQTSWFLRCERKEKNFNSDTVTCTSIYCINVVERSVGKKYYLTLKRKKSDKILSTKSFHTEYF